MYTYMYVRWIYIHIIGIHNNLKEIVLNSCHSDEWSGLGAAALAPNCMDIALKALSSARSFLCASCGLENNLLGTGRPTLSKKLLNVPRRTKASSIAFQGVPKRLKGCPKRPKKNPKSTQAEKTGVEGHTKEANKSQNKNSTQCRIVGTYVYTYLHIIYIYIFCIRPPCLQGEGVLE